MNTLYKASSLLLLVCILLFSSGCKNIFNPFESDNPSEQEYPNTTPLEVLNNLRTAYQTKNIELYKKCLDTGFRFELLSSDVNEIGTDVDGDGVRDAWWGYQQEVEYQTNLFKYGSSDGVYPPPDQIDLQLQVPPAEAWETDNQTGHEGWMIIACPFTLTLTYSNSVSIATGYARFYLKPSNGGWYIAIWRDESQI